MLKLKHITKKYNKEIILKEIDVSFPKSGFTSILGPSGSGKTTLLNIIGGLDKYTSGELYINGINTKNYKDKDWDNYRNNKIGFIFQNYNLLEHLNVIENVKIPLSIKNISNKEKNNKAIKYLKQVGLENHFYDRVNTLSGGEKQRVSIARSLISNPSILLCDEPTGALDTQNSIAIMNILKDISKDKLVIMVTHNEELANIYSDRIITIKDGIINSDSNPYKGKNINNNKNKKNKKMSVKTCINISFNNLLTKKKRTILTSLAASIGIIGISLILSLSNGVKEYISKEQRNTFNSYPIEIKEEELKYSGIENSNTKEITCNKNMICTKDDISNSNEVIDSLALKKNNLSKFKQFLDNNNEIKKYSNINYNYDLELNIYSLKYNKVNPTNKTFTNNILGITDNTIFKKINMNNDYKLIKGKYPKKYNELLLIVDKDNKINMSLLYNLDIESLEELNKKINNSNNKLSLKNKNYSYNDFLNKKFKLVLNTDYYKKNNTWYKITNKDEINTIIDKSITLSIVGIAKENNNNSYVGYSNLLIDYLLKKNKESNIYKEQLNKPNLDILTNKKFDNITYEDRLKTLGIIDYNKPTSIEIYPNSFESKIEIEKLIRKYNHSQKAKDKITYTDILGVLLETITSIINIISYILIALVAISLIVSSIMIAIITHISVLERTKEIGILRAIGVSKKDITRLFLSEKLLEGILASIISISISRLLIIPANILIEKLTKITNLVSMNYKNTIILLLVSISITMISGLRPAKKASKIEIIEALRNID